MIDKNIVTTTKAAQEIERKLRDEELSLDEILSLSKELMQYMNAAALLHQIKAAQQQIQFKENKIIRM